MKKHSIKHYISFCGGWPPCTKKIDDRAWILAMNMKRPSFKENPAQGWGVCEPIFFLD